VLDNLDKGYAMRTLLGLLILGVFVPAAHVLAEQPELKNLRLNQIQVVGTHNSYHVRPPAGILKAAIAIRKDAKDWDYTRQPLDQQLDLGIRNFELDLNLSDKGWQVMHVPGFDAGTTVPMFADALTIVSRWSQAHPRHVPISLLLECKEEGFQLSRAYRRPEAKDILQLDEQIRAAIPAERLLTPDDVRGQHKTLWDAVRHNGWPTLSAAAGKIFVILHENGANRAAYLEGHPSLEGRAMFVESSLAQPHSAVLIRNDPTDPQIGPLARAGYLIRTRVDAQGDERPERRKKGLASGAHVLTTDYPRGEMATERAFGLPGGAAARTNPVTGPAAARTADITEPLPEQNGQ